MALTLTRENYFWHKVHSLTGIIPVGYYMVQHLALNSFTLGGAESFNSVIHFFEGIPKHVLLAMEIFAIWIPLLFHAVYGLFIVGRAKPNFIGSKYGWSQNRMYTFQRYSGVFLFVALIVHVCTTTLVKYRTGDVRVVEFNSWQEKLTSYGGVWLIFYVLLVLFASYHLAYGIWNFCIRWGITISDKAQIQVQKFAFGAFVLLTLLGWSVLVGFLINPKSPEPGGESVQAMRWSPVDLARG